MLFTEEAILSSFGVLATDHKCTDSFLGSLYCSIGLYVLFYLWSCYFGYYTFAVYFKIWYYDASSLVLFAQNFFGYLVPLVVLYKFYDFLFYFCEKCQWNFGRDCIESVDHFAEFGHFSKISSNPRTWNIFPFICEFNFSHQCFIVFSVQTFHSFG